MPRFVPQRSLVTGIVGLLVVLAGCGGAAPTNAPPAAIGPTATAAALPTEAATPIPAATADVDHPVGVIAMGHSGLTGEGTAGPLVENKDASWATGTLPTINSVYLRMVEVVPATEGHVANTASGGASSSILQRQTEAALAIVPVPALAIIQTVDQDIQCSGSNVASVGQRVAAVLELINQRSPNTKILVVGQLGRPSVEFVKTLVAMFPAAKAELTGSDPCAFFTPDGKLNEAGFESLSNVIDRYEAETARVCAAAKNCITDGGVRKAWIDKLELFSADHNHLNARGQAAEAELIWPVVKELLGI